MNELNNDLYLGQPVHHVKFGYGAISAIEGNKIAVDFEAVGTKKMLASFLRDPETGEPINGRPLVAANDNKPEPAPPAMHPAPFTPEAAGGILEDIAGWITRTSIEPVPELSLCSAIALLAALYGGKAIGPTKSGVNLFLATIMDTAGGKGHPPASIHQIAMKLGRVGADAVCNGDHTSYAALERTLRRAPSTAIVMDEFGITLQDVNAKGRSSPAASIRKFLLAIYDQSDKIFDGRIYASAETKKEATPLIGPALTVLGMTTSETLYEGLSETSVADGFLNRFLFVTASKSEATRAPSLNRQVEPPTDIVEALKLGLEAFPEPESGQRKYTVQMEGGEGGEAYARYSEVYFWEKSSWWRSDVRSIIGRASENTIRLATLRAISRRPGSPVVTLGDVEWAWAIVHHSVTLIREGVAMHFSESPADRLRKDILAVVSEFPDGIAFSKLLERKGVRGADTFRLKDALQWLVDAEAIKDLKGKSPIGSGSRIVLVPNSELAIKMRTANRA